MNKMKERVTFMTKHYLINGGKPLWNFMKPAVSGLVGVAKFLCSTEFQVMFRLIALCVAFFTGMWMIAALAILLPIPSKMEQVLGVKAGTRTKAVTAPKKGVRIKINTTGLKDDNLKLFQSFAKRIKLVGEVADPTVDEAVVMKKVRAALAKVGINKEAAKIMAEFLDTSDKGFRAKIKAIGTEVTELKARAGEALVPKDYSLHGQIRSWQKKNKEMIKLRQAGQNVNLPPIKIKNYRAANVPMLPANTLTSTVGANNAFITSLEIENGLTEPVRRKPTLWDYITKGSVSAATYVWVNKFVAAGSGAANFIAPGVLKPFISFELRAETSVAKKIAVSDKIATELLDDVPGMASYITDELEWQLKDRLNVAVATDTVSATNINGMRTLSVGFSATGLSTANPNRWDAIRSIVAQMNSGNLNAPVTVFVNPIDKANLDMTKANSEGQRFAPGEIGATIVEDNNIPVGFVQAAMLQYYIIKIYKGFSMSWGWENDDFTKNLVTVIGEMRLHQIFKAQYTGALVYDSFANIMAAIDEAP